MKSIFYKFSFAIAILSAISFENLPVLAQQVNKITTDCDYINHMITPAGNCINLDYLGNGQQNRNSASVNRSDSKKWRSIRTPRSFRGRGCRGSRGRLTSEN